MKLLNDIFYCYRGKGLLWFRIFNSYGLAIKNTHKAPLLFNERVLKHGLLIGKYHFSILK